MRVAWDRRLTFTIGTSVTSGITDTVVWNEIHHKTSVQNYSGHGYPDPGYLDRVMLELAAQGVTDETDDSDDGQSSSSSSSEEEEEEEEKKMMVEEEGEEHVGGASAVVQTKLKGDSKANAIVLLSDEDDDL